MADGVSHTLGGFLCTHILRRHPFPTSKHDWNLSTSPLTPIPLVFKDCGFCPLNPTQLHEHTWVAGLLPKF